MFSAPVECSARDSIARNWQSRRPPGGSQRLTTPEPPDPLSPPPQADPCRGIILVLQPTRPTPVGGPWVQPKASGYPQASPWQHHLHLRGLKVSRRRAASAVVPFSTLFLNHQSNRVPISGDVSAISTFRFPGKAYFEGPGLRRPYRSPIPYPPPRMSQP